ncbi:hypothetical protein [Mycobacterium riyadhense]|uniref:hypothetical protein n=1 Tax=Mycobacterium riyadhense TaxID=486698 RepID=UPI0019575A1F|nr:hypothetical protein [Mycobacterium riyadhense]MCV7147178.1 hypothetical protein [Mycobacterium riyadhense]
MTQLGGWRFDVLLRAGPDRLSRLGSWSVPLLLQLAADPLAWLAVRRLSARAA